MLARRKSNPGQLRCRIEHAGKAAEPYVKGSESLKPFARECLILLASRHDHCGLLGAKKIFTTTLLNSWLFVRVTLARSWTSN